MKPAPTPGNVLVSAAALVIVIAGMRHAEAILVPFLLAAFISVVAAPPLFWLKRHKVPSPLAIALVIAVVLGAMVLLATLIGTSLNDFTRNLPDLQSRITDEMAAAAGWLNRWGLHLSQQELMGYLDPGQMMQWFSRVLKGLGGVLSNTLLILLTVIFILAEVSSFPLKLHAVLGSDNNLKAFHQFLHNVQTYVGIKTITSLVTGLLITMWLMILGVDYALLWGLLAFIFNFVPNIGSIIAAIPGILIALVQLGPGSALLAGAGYLVVNIVIGNAIEPRFMGRGLGLSTLVVFLSLLFWGWVLGPVGMLLSVPLTMTAKIALDSREDTRWLAVLLGSERAVQNTVESDS